MPISTRQLDNVDTLPPGSQLGEFSPWQPPPRRSLGWAEIVALGGVLIVTLLIGYWLIGRDVRSWIQYGGGGWVVQAALVLAFISAGLWIARRAVLVDQRGYRVPFWHIDRIVPQLIAVDEAFASTPGRMVRAQTISYPSKVEQIAAPVETMQIVDSGPVLVPDSEWLPWITEMPHTMIAGGTGTGKTTMARIELYERLQHGHAGIVLDPKGKDWYGLPVIGGGRKFEAILAALDTLHIEMAQRFEAYAQGTRHFEPIKALVDEVPDIMDACLDMRRRLSDGRWSRFARQLGSLAREIGISVTLMTQSPLVEDIGMNSAMRKNFTRIALGDEAPLLIREERDAARRTQLQDLLRGQQYPAAMMRRGQVHLLNTSNVPMLSNRQIVRPLGWQPPATLSAQQPARPVVSAYQQTKVERASVEVPGAIVYPPTVKSTNGKIAWLLRSGYSYRQIERELSVSHATIRAVNVALQNSNP